MRGLAFEFPILGGDIVEVTPVLIQITRASSLFLQVKGSVVFLEACVGRGVIFVISCVVGALFHGDLTEEIFQLLEFLHVIGLQGIFLLL